ncbi:MAG TPA: hypothetical protein VGG64_21075 [Pirellulales bacterium]|jgi:hypothetical protein
MNEPPFEILLASPPEYDDLVAEIHRAGKFIAQVAMIDGVIVLETPGIDLNESTILRRVELDGFLAAIEKARKRLTAPKRES